MSFRGGHGQQYAHQKTPADALVFPVAAGQTTTVDETLLPGGTLDISVSDKISGAPVDSVCVKLFDSNVMDRCGATNGNLRLTDLPNQTYTIELYASDGLHHRVRLHDVVVELGETTAVSAAPDPAAAITTQVRDAQTGGPSAFECVYPVTMEFGASGYGEHCRYQSDYNGQVVVGELPEDTFTLLVVPYGAEHGMQWVGYSGGTGSQYDARRIHTTLGQSVAIPAVHLDPAGTLSGVLTDSETGAPIEHGHACASVLPAAVDSQPGGYRCSGTGGRYEISGLGPYQWPVQFRDWSGKYAWHFSGGTADRRNAEKVTITSGQTATADTVLKPAAKITGRVLEHNGNSFTAGTTVSAFNARTGDLAGPSGYAFSNSYELGGLSAQDVKIQYLPYGRVPGWYETARTSGPRRRSQCRPDRTIQQTSSSHHQTEAMLVTAQRHRERRGRVAADEAQRD